MLRKKESWGREERENCCEQPGKLSRRYILGREYSHCWGYYKPSLYRYDENMAQTHRVGRLVNQEENSYSVHPGLRHHKVSSLRPNSVCMEIKLSWSHPTSPPTITVPWALSWALGLNR